MAFAANSVLCRLALGTSAIDPASFTVLRLLSGSMVLLLILKISTKPHLEAAKGSWSASVMLFLYAVTFSFAYITLDTATGALILFGSVQLSIIVISYFLGNHLKPVEWLGVAIAFLGLIYLVWRNLTTPSLIGFVLMGLAGTAWGIYTLKGKESAHPLNETTYNFLRTLPMIFILALIALPIISYSWGGIVLAVLSGAIASGLGYTIWYMALRGLAATQAAVVQLFVPILAAFGGVLIVNEPFTYRLILSALLIFGGILLVILRRTQPVLGSVPKET